MEEKVTSKAFFDEWLKVVKINQDILSHLWDNNSAYTWQIKGISNSIVNQVANELNINVYETDYYGIDVAFYKEEDLVKCRPKNTYWVHTMRVCFEHENNFSSGLYKEVSHLLLMDCDLRVLVTYPNGDYNYTKSELDKLSEIISSNRRSQNISEEKSFLIILGYKLDDESLKWNKLIFRNGEWEGLDQIR